MFYRVLSLFFMFKQKIKGQDYKALTWRFMEPMSGFEPLTYALRVRCSTS